MLIRVLEIPFPSGNYHFDGGEPQTFVEVDWFTDEGLGESFGPEHEEIVRSAIKHKRYFNPTQAYLVLSAGYSFTINYPHNPGK